MSSPRYPSLFQINTRVRLAELSRELRRPATLDDVTDEELDLLAADGFDLVWFLGVWQTGDAARRVSRSKPEWLAEYRRVLPDFQEADVTGSCFAVRGYRVHEEFGGDAAPVAEGGAVSIRMVRVSGLDSADQQGAAEEDQRSQNRSA